MQLLLSTKSLFVLDIIIGYALLMHNGNLCVFSLVFLLLRHHLLGAVRLYGIQRIVTLPRPPAKYIFSMDEWKRQWNSVIPAPAQCTPYTIAGRYCCVFWICFSMINNKVRSLAYSLRYIAMLTLGS